MPTPTLELILLEPDDIRRHPSHVRDLSQESRLLEILTDDVAARGIARPGLVFPMPGGDALAGPFGVVLGYRRGMACKRAGRPFPVFRSQGSTLEAVLKQLEDDANGREISMDSEDELILRLYAEGYTQGEINDLTDISQSVISRAVRRAVAHQPLPLPALLSDGEAGTRERLLLSLSGYWSDFANVQRHIREIAERCGNPEALPPRRALEEVDGLLGAIKDFGGMAAVAARLGFCIGTGSSVVALPERLQLPAAGETVVEATFKETETPTDSAAFIPVAPEVQVHLQNPDLEEGRFEADEHTFSDEWRPEAAASRSVATGGSYLTPRATQTAVVPLLGRAESLPERSGPPERGLDVSEVERALLEMDAVSARVNPDLFDRVSDLVKQGRLEDAAGVLFAMRLALENIEKSVVNLKLYCAPLGGDPLIAGANLSDATLADCVGDGVLGGHLSERDSFSDHRRSA